MQLKIKVDKLLKKKKRLRLTKTTFEEKDMLTYISNPQIKKI